MVDPGLGNTIKNTEKFKIFVNQMALIRLNIYIYYTGAGIAQSV
jgi:hypothetical protein